MIVVSKYMVPKGYAAIALFPFVFVKYNALKEDQRFINHERIHLRQQLELLIFPFFVWYGLEFLVRYIRHKNWYLAYKAISFEQEAYTHEYDLEYLRSRKFWKFLAYM